MEQRYQLNGLAVMMMIIEGNRSFTKLVPFVFIAPPAGLEGKLHADFSHAEY